VQEQEVRDEEEGSPAEDQEEGGGAAEGTDPADANATGSPSARRVRHGEGSDVE